MNRRSFLCGSLLAVATPLSAESQPSTRVVRIGYLGSTAAPEFREAFERGLRELGWSRVKIL